LSNADLQDYRGEKSDELQYTVSTADVFANSRTKADGYVFAFVAIIERRSSAGGYRRADYTLANQER
jgi:hypothetical protein